MGLLIGYSFIFLCMKMHLSIQQNRNEYLTPLTGPERWTRKPVCSAFCLKLYWLPSLSVSPLSLSLSSTEFCETAVITGNFQGASPLDSWPLLTECEHDGAWRYVWDLCVFKKKACKCLKRSIWGKWGLSLMDLVYRLRWTEIDSFHTLLITSGGP